MIVSNTSYSNNHNNNLKNVYEHLRNKQFTEAINKLKDLSEKNKPEAQLLYAKILYSGEITPQDFENGQQETLAVSKTSELTRTMPVSKKYAEEIEKFKSQKK